MHLRSILLCGSMSLLAPVAAQAGDQVLRGEAPEWVVPVQIGALDLEGGPAELIADYQHRLEAGVVRSYYDSAVRIDNPQALMEQNTVSLGWLPDKGDLTVHRLEIHRKGEVIDVLGQGVEFDVIRREQALEARLLDGALTATLSIPGLRVGDVLRTTYSVTIRDQALGDEVQVLQYLGSEPWRVGMGRSIVSWPEGDEIYWSAEEHAALAEPELRDGYRYLTVEMPLPEAKAMPRDAPSRYLRPTVLRVGSFSGWNELSRVMAPHFLAAAEIGADSAVAREADAIMRKSSDPLARAALATRLVQDEVSYLMNGLDGGDDLPQAAEFTWDKRYGDCKAKTVLLLALLQHMGIEAEPVLVATNWGDALPELLAVPGNFDHVIVRARIGDVDYWLDGTSTATRLANIGDVPLFHYALPLRENGAELVAMSQRHKANPDMVMTAASDHSAGIDFPQLLTMKIEIAGTGGAMIEAMADANDPQFMRRLAGTMMGQSDFKGGVLTSFQVSYDKEAALGTISMESIAPPNFRWEAGKFVVDADNGPGEFDFNPNRSRPEWRQVPVATPGPSYVSMNITMTLPEGGKGFSLTGPGTLGGEFANRKIATSTELVGDTVRVRSEVRMLPGEIAPGDIAATRREARRFEAEVTDLVAPTEVTWRWDLDANERKRRAAPIIAAYDRAIEFALEDDYGPLTQKASFLLDIYEYEAALAAYDELVEKTSSAWSHLQRASTLLALGRREEAIAEAEALYDLEPTN